MNPIIDLRGHQFGRLQVVSFACVENKHARWNCVCVCGNTHVASGVNLRKGNVKSCGCALLEAKKHGGAHRGKKSSEYLTWVSMRQRCQNPKNKRYDRYGGRGIYVCERWGLFDNFLRDMGAKPSPTHSIDRVNNDGPYSPENCKWSTTKEQTSNNSRNISVVYDGRSMTLMQAVELTGRVRYGAALYRYRRGYPIEAVLA